MIPSVLYDICKVSEGDYMTNYRKRWLGGLVREDGFGQCLQAPLLNTVSPISVSK
jgi:hypothetical protein